MSIPHYLPAEFCNLESLLPWKHMGALKCTYELSVTYWHTNKKRDYRISAFHKDHHSRKQNEPDKIPHFKGQEQTRNFPSQQQTSRKDNLLVLNLSAAHIRQARESRTWLCSDLISNTGLSFLSLPISLPSPGPPNTPLLCCVQRCVYGKQLTPHSWPNSCRMERQL